MNKHKKQVRRERRKADQSRRRSLFRKPQASSLRSGGAAALAAAAAIAAGTSAYAAPVRFDNPPGPGHFDWVTNEFLDVRMDAASQVSISGAPGIFHQTIYSPYGGYLAGGASGTNLQRIIPTGNWAYAIGVESSVLIPTPTPGISFGNALIDYYGTSFLAESTPTYLGVQFDLGTGFQYGWIGVVMNAQFELDAFAWGYETEQGVPIAAGAPEPGSLALLALGAGALIRRRRHA